MRRQLLLISIIITIFITFASRTPIHARDVVVDVCDFASLQSAVTIANDGGGIITFDCMGTIIFTEQLVINADVIIIGDGDIIFDGGVTTRFFAINEDKSLTLNDLTLRNGFASYGGAIITEWKTTLTISNCTFLNNSVSNSEPSFRDGRGGSAIYNGGRMTIRNSTFSGNSGEGGAIANIGWSTIIDSTFTDNPNGAIVNDNYWWGSVTVSDSTFTNNSAENGGAIQNGDITITNSTFTGNSATESGGAISTNGWVTISDSTFTNNLAKNGGAIASDSKLANGGSLTITNTVFTDNSASEKGGAIYHTGDEITLTGNTFLDNSATDQSAIFSDGRIISKDTRYENNTCGGYGVFDDEGGNTSQNALGCPPDVVPMGTTVTDCTNFTGDGTISQAVITANTSSEPITFTCSGTIVFTSSLFISGDVTIIGGGNITFDGGGETGLFVVGYYQREFPLPNEVIPLSSLLIDGVTLKNGAGMGAIFNDEYGTLTVNNSTFIGNHSATIANRGTLIVSNSTFMENHSAGITNNGIATIITSTFSNNVVTEGSGSAIANRGTVTIITSTFSNNATLEGGGGIINDGTATIITSTFSNNVAQGNGAIMNNGQVSIQDTRFENNTCGGAGVFTNNGGNTTYNANGCPNDTPTTTVVSDCKNFTGSGTLYEAVSVANATGEPITFTCSGTIVFSEILTITGLVIINGNGNIILDGGGVSTFFSLSWDGASLALDNLILQNGNSAVVPLINNLNGTVVISNSTFRDNVGRTLIFNYGSLTITDSTFSENSHSILYSSGNLTIANSTFANNLRDIPTDTMLGDINIGHYGTATISNSTFSNATSHNLISNMGRLTITANTFTDNSSQGDSIISNGGSLIIADSTFNGNSAITINERYINRGGAIKNSGILTIINSTFGDNGADLCGAIFNSHILTITNSIFMGNSANQGGAICNTDRLTITNSTFSNNSANQGGAIFNGELDEMRVDGINWLTITDSTLSDNTATEGGAIFNVTDSTFLSQDTHYDNNDCAGSGVFTDNGGNTTDNADGCPDGS